MNPDWRNSAYFIAFLACVTVIGAVESVYLMTNRRRFSVLERLRGIKVTALADEEDVLKKPLMERTVGVLAASLIGAVSQATPSRLLKKIEERLVRAGNPRNTEPGDFLTFQTILGLATPVIAWYLMGFLKVDPFRRALFSLAMGALAAYAPWFALSRAGTARRRQILRSLPDIMDLLVVSVEAGLAFDMALLRVVERFRGAVGQEFQQALREIQLGKTRKDALKDMADRVDLMELSSLVSAVLQADQLGVGIGNVLRLQADLVRDKRQQAIEELAMKAPIKMLFPLIFLIFPSIFVVLLGPAILNIMKAFGAV